MLGTLKGGRPVLEKGQYALALLFFVMGVALLQAALDAIAPGFTFLVLDTILLINSQITVRIRYRLMALITFYLA
jgi:hypothetical protein